MAYQICTRTVMDNIADPDIRFDEDGVCNYYHEFLEKLQLRVPEPAAAKAFVDKLVAGMKTAGKGKRYDCVIGVSGGVDSTYTAWLLRQWGLRPLAVHVDNGWNSELAVKNIESTLQTLDIDLYTEVLDWPAFSDLQRSFLKASTPDAEIPTDHILWAAIYKVAAKFGIRHIISGMNFRTEGMLPPSWSRGYLDWKYISSVHKIFGSKNISKLPHFTLSQLAWYASVRRMKVIGILNYVDFKKADALQVLMNEIGYRPYEGKHHESVYTRFFQTAYLPMKFGIDKRKAHLSCMIMGSREITREQAMEALQQPPATEQQVKQDIAYIKKKLALVDADWDAIMQAPAKTIFDYPNNHIWELRVRRQINKWRKRGWLSN